jgi:DNA-binding MarR family transcriptional regulator
MRYAAAIAKRMGIETSELAALSHLQEAGPMTLGRLGERLSMSPGAVTALVDRLERRGHVERFPNPKDRTAGARSCIRQRLASRTHWSTCGHT